ncbi:PilC/PilY family type IV pilus protein [Denitratisoma oestradiolicum]|uniref:Uncharacterized protein n=1 Tax=Denitratisoma oestradiolicum TaxID=311182 RepID=A0A6S6XQ62_9PROT|nr:PilC/PilY family type IV pilus protein [Denitratisoma oestradiolicum]TWO79557.1 hypothetical protein CBW56_14160 [Denitratisoma oestradiolicum]CAB1368051.1 conserved exported protein of unknown function [Denitratisoma oestradiolicum]
MNTRRLLSRILVASLILLTGQSGLALDLVGDDTDLFMTNPNNPAQIPNVLIVLDNTSNWSNQAQHWPDMVDATCTAAGITGNQQGDAEVCAIYKSVANLGETVNLGLMMFNDQDKGGYVRYAVRSMTSANKTSFRTSLATISTNDPADKTASNSSYGNPMNDAFRYFNGFGTYNGAGEALADSAGYTSVARTTFVAPDKSGGSCGYDYIIFIGNGFPNSETLNDIDNAAALLNDPSVTANKTTINATGVNADVWSRFLYKYGVKISNGVYRHITTYSVDVCKDQCDTDQATLLTSMANVGGGRYFKATNLSEIENALSTIFSEVQAINSVFAAVALPISNNQSGLNLNQVYIGMFRPDGQKKPRWFGNLKMYTSNIDPANPELIDSLGAQIRNPNTGNIYNTVTSYWTTDSSFWSFRGPDYDTTDVGQESDAPDGDISEKGGAGQRVRTLYPLPDSESDQTRKLYTCTGTCTANSEFADYPFNVDNSDITAASLGTYQLVSVSALSYAAANTPPATATAPSHGFNTGDSVVISGASPSGYNGTFTITKVDDNTFRYTPATAPDSTNAYGTTSASHNLTVNDKITVTGSTPAGYNVSEVAVTPVTSTQYSYPLAATVSANSSGYAITAKRRINANNLTGTGSTATVNLTGHGYSNNDSVTISGATPAEFNGTFTISVVNANTFTYTTASAIPGGTPTTAIATTAAAHGLQAGDSIVVAGATAPNTAYNNTTTVLASPEPTATTFAYTTSGTVSNNATGTLTVSKTVQDNNTRAVSAGAVSGSGANKIITFTYSATATTANGCTRTLAAGDQITISGITCKRSNNTVQNCSTGSTTTPVASSYNLTLAAGNIISGTQVSMATDNNTASVTLSSATLRWPQSGNASCQLTAQSVSSAVPGNAIATATGTTYASKTGDLTSPTTTLGTQAVASGTIVAGLASSADVNERANLINWVRGIDNKENENSNSGATSSTDVRASVHADVLHSKPATVNYNRNGDDNDVYVFYGTNDGIFHAIKGGTGSDGGNEKWGFVAPEFFSKLKRLRDNSPLISSNAPKGYFFDGPIVVYTLDVNKDGSLVADDGDKAYLFVTMRRGGRMIYALDVSDPDNPKLLWKKGCTESSGTASCDTDYGEIGQTWSEPMLGYVEAYQTKNASNVVTAEKLVVLMGAGYDAAVEDFQPCMVTAHSSSSVSAKTGVALPNSMDTSNCPPDGGTTATASRSMGRDVYIIDAEDGDMLWRASTVPVAKRSGTIQYSVAAGVAAFNGDLDRRRTLPVGTETGVFRGYLDRIYAADTGGNVWRIDIGSTTTSNWTLTKLASLSGSDATAPLTDRRKFLSRPDVALSRTTSPAYDAVLLGSGDREHPFDMVVDHRFYMLKDTAMASNTVGSVTQANPITESDLYDVTDNCIQACATAGERTGAQADLAAAQGWMLRLTDEGEISTDPAKVDGGSVLFSTHSPQQGSASTTQCVNDLGTARIYAVNFRDATATVFAEDGNYNRSEAVAGGGFLPAPITTTLKDADSGNTVRTDCFGIHCLTPSATPLDARLRTYWYRRQD